MLLYCGQYACTEVVTKASALSLNAGLLLRVAAEPIERMGQGTALTQVTLALVALLQVSAILIFATQLWPRVAPRSPHKAEPTAP